MVSASGERRAAGTPRSTKEKIMKVPRANQPREDGAAGEMSLADPAEVVTVMVDVVNTGVPEAVTVEGEKVQAALAGS